MFERVIRNFENNKIESIEDDYIIPPGFVNIANPVIIGKALFALKRRFLQKKFIRTFHNFTGSKFNLYTKWMARKTKTFFTLKNKCLQPACKIYHGVRSCGKTYVEETIGNVDTNWNKHNMPSEKLNPSKHLNSKMKHHFS